MTHKIENARSVVDLSWQMFLVFAVTCAISMVPEAAFAAANAIETALCNVVLLMTGNTGRAIAIIAVIVVGLGALMGKVSWGLALIVALGIALVFGAATIVDAVSGGGGACAGGVIQTGTVR